MTYNKDNKPICYGLIKYFSVILGAFSLFFILAIELTEGHRWIDINNGEKWNEIFIEIWYAILASSIFYLATVSLPNHVREKRDIKNSQPLFYAIIQSLRLCIDSVKPFYLIGGSISKEEFITCWKNKNMQETSVSTFGMSVEEYIAQQINQIYESVISLLSLRNLPESYYDVIQEIYLSDVIRDKFRPNYFLEVYNDNNQQEFGESLYDLYESVRTFYYTEFTHNNNHKIT